MEVSWVDKDTKTEMKTTVGLQIHQSQSANLIGDCPKVRVHFMPSAVLSKMGAHFLIDAKEIKLLLNHWKEQKDFANALNNGNVGLGKVNSSARMYKQAGIKYIIFMFCKIEKRHIAYVPKDQALLLQQATKYLESAVKCEEIEQCKTE